MIGNDKYMKFIDLYGSSQEDRYTSILDPNYIKVDEHKLAELQAFIYEYADLLNFYNAENKIQGSWQHFVEADISFLLANISIIDVHKINETYHELLIDYEAESTIDIKAIKFQTLFMKTYDLVLMLDDWLKLGYESDPNYKLSELANQLQSAIENKLSGKLNKLLSIADKHDQLNKENKLNINKSQLEIIWRVSDNFDDFYPEFTFKSAGKHLTFLFKDFLGTVSFIVSYAPKLLEYSLNKDQHHAPQNALLITFLKLYSYAQQELNQITKKHLDYYFFKRLKQSHKDAVADKVYLSLTLADHIDEYVIKKKTQFLSGTDEEGIDYLYEADHDLSVNKTRVSGLKVLFFNKNPEITEGGFYSLISNVYKTDVVDLVADLDSFNKNTQSFATFGEDPFRTIEKDQIPMDYGEIGFAVTSPVLVLKEGVRNIDINFKFHIKSLSALVSLLEGHSLVDNQTAESIFQKVLDKSLEIELSTFDGWYQVKEYTIAPDKDWINGIIKIRIELKITDPAIESLNPELPDYARYQSDWPILKCILNTDESMFAFTYLLDLELEECQINVEVEKIKGIQISNNIGKIDPSNPFYPFDTVPTLGSYLLIGYNELYNKTIHDLSIYMQWQNLPREDNGFAAYYSEYEEDFSNDVFKVSLTALSGFEFLPIETKKIQQFNLFETEPSPKGKSKKHKLLPTTVLRDIDIKALQIENDYTLNVLPDYNNTTRSGYLKLELITPEGAFGHSIYPNLFANRVLENSKFSSKKSQLKLPSTPFSPQLRSIDLNYKASTTIYMDNASSRLNDSRANEKFYHIHPFGLDVTHKKSTTFDNHLLPQYKMDGYLYIGLSHLIPGQTLTLYFVLEQNPGRDYDVILPTISWMYLSEDQWLPFDRNQVVFDSTNNFTVSGIVKLIVPVNITSENHILSSGQFWISAMVKGDVNHLSKTRAVYTQALSATWVPHKTGAQWQDSKLPNTINSLAIPRSEIDSILQPEMSFGGVERENDANFYARVSERLRHKNRAVAKWDYEHLVLEKFPFIQRVKCLSITETDSKLKSGEVLIVVVPKVLPNENFYLPKLNYNALSEVQQFLDKISTPFAKTRAINPLYERVKISCSLKFNDNLKKGELIQQLHEELLQYLCPWFYRGSSDMIFGGGLKREELISFIESRDYVLFVTKLSAIIVHYYHDTYTLSDTVVEDSDNKEISGSTLWSVLVPMEKHQFDILEKTTLSAPEKAAIENMRLGDDFVISGEEDIKPDSAEEDFPAYKKENDDDYYVIEIDI